MQISCNIKQSSCVYDIYRYALYAYSIYLSIVHTWYTEWDPKSCLTFDDRMRRMRYLCQTQLLTFQSCRYINVHVMQLSMIIFTSPWFFLHIHVSFCSRIFPWLTGGFFFAAQSWVCFPMTLKQGLDLFGGGFGQLRLGFLTGGFPKEKKPWETRGRNYC